jgi:hypothetical protein
MSDNDFSAIALFCEDIREESRGQVTLVGVVPDNGAVAEIPATIPKFCAFIRVNFSPERPPESLATFLRLPDGTEVAYSDHDVSGLRQSSKDAIEKGNPLVGSVGRVVGINFPISSEGLIGAFAKINGEERLAGFVRFSLAKPA